MLRPPTAALAGAVVLLLAARCSMARLGRDLDQLDRLALISGTIEGGESVAPILAVLVRESATAGPAVVEDAAALPPAVHRFAFVVQAGAPYRVAAVADENGNGAPDPGEPAGEASAGVLRLAPDERRTDLAIRLTRRAALPDVFRQAPADAISTAQRLPIAAGELVTLDDPRFTLEEAASGMWQPVRTSLERGVGVYFLEPYDPGRIPVVFVHGIGGTPRDFQAVIAALDRQTFQPWVFAYPSGARLERVARALAELLIELDRAHHFPTLVLTAHSMGGLVSRGAILELARRDRDDLVDLFVTFATPWNGHAAAVKGVRWAPSTVPAWIDMQPQSEFLAAVRAPLPSRLPFYLLFGYDTGRYNPLMAYSHDTVVSVSSQLAQWAQNDARGIWGFQATHEAILQQEEPLTRWRGLLAAAAASAR